MSEHSYAKTAALITSAAVFLSLFAGLTLTSAAAPSSGTVSSTPDFNYTFSSKGTLHETSTSEESTSPYWWLASGGTLTLGSGVGKTIHGDLPTADHYRVKYARSAPDKTDNGYHPQNIFRLFTKEEWGANRQEIDVHISRGNLFSSESAQPWNGVFLVHGFTDGESFYYAGIRMDGTAAIKKKTGDIHATLDQKTIFGGEYDQFENPFLLPTGSFIGMRLDVVKTSSGALELSLYIDKNNNGSWELAAKAVDQSAPILLGRLGVMSNYMDIMIDNYAVYGANTTVESTTVENTVVTAPVEEPVVETDPEPAPTAATEPSVSSGSFFGLDTDRTIEEGGSLTSSPDSEWWVNSGAYFTVENGIGKTVHGKLPQNDPWRILYGNNNPLDTDGGYYPQNIFRLVSKGAWQDVEQQGYFNIAKYNASASSNREGHNGILFFSRYKDGNNLYYTGIRVDGKAIIKKKISGKYYTLASNTVFSGSYNRDSNPNLIPENRWVGLRSVVKDTADGVSIEVYADTEGNGNWKLVAKALDDGRSYGATITAKASAGIRTDFMDVSVKEYSLKEL